MLCKISDVNVPLAIKTVLFYSSLVLMDFKSKRVSPTPFALSFSNSVESDSGNFPSLAASCWAMFRRAGNPASLCNCFKNWLSYKPLTLRRESMGKDPCSGEVL